MNFLFLQFLTIIFLWLKIIFQHKYQFLLFL
nr:MAG TPA: hypothetical protein [Caudoviricetes sp.]